jgi:hypothetical protein
MCIPNQSGRACHGMLCCHHAEHAVGPGGPNVAQIPRLLRLFSGFGSKPNAPIVDMQPGTGLRQSMQVVLELERTNTAVANVSVNLRVVL